MKRIILGLGMVCLSFAVLAAANDVLLMFSTNGPDTYSDGSDVSEGECYALCYVTDSASFAIKADGTAIGGEVLLTAPVATKKDDGNGMHCPNLVYIVPASRIESLKGGSYEVYLLDTRTSTTAGAPLANGKDGAPLVVNGAGKVVSGGVAGTGDSNPIAQLPKAPGNGSAVQVASIIDKPDITFIRVEGAKVVLTVANLSPAAEYHVVKGTDVSDVSAEVASTVEGNTLTVSKDADSAKFFKVIGTRKVPQ